MDNSHPKKKSSFNRYIIPALFVLILIATTVVFTVTILSMAGLTPGG